MRLHLRRVLVLLGGAAGASVVAAVLVVGCGGDDTGAANAPDGSSSQNADSTTDAPQQSETGSADGGEPGDGGTTGDSGSMGDGGLPGDANGDSGPVDSGHFDSGITFDASTLLNFPLQTAQAYCSRLQQCCLVSTASWNQTSCVSAIENNGGVRGLGNYAASLDSGNVDYNPVAAAACLNDIAAVPCGNLTSVTVLNLQSDCYGALVGTLSTNSGPCKTSLECVSGNYCSSSARDGGSCVQVQGLNGPCTRTLDDECSYLGTGISTFCALDGGVGQCQATEPIEAGCSTNAQCQSGLCGGAGCTTQEVLTDPGVPGGTCDFFTVKDGG